MRRQRLLASGFALLFVPGCELDAGGAPSADSSTGAPDVSSREDAGLGTVKSPEGGGQAKDAARDVGPHMTDATTPDAGAETAAPDAGSDVPTMADAVPDTTVPVDAGQDTGTDAGQDASDDAGQDAGEDAGCVATGHNDHGVMTACCSGVDDGNKKCVCAPLGASDNLDASNCCSGQSTGGVCTCTANGLPLSGSPDSCCAGTACQGTRGILFGHGDDGDSVNCCTLSSTSGTCCLPSGPDMGDPANCCGPGGGGGSC